MKNIAILSLIYMAISTPAYAYLDPGTGSLVVSIIIGVIATAIYIFKDFFYGLKNKSKKKK